MITPWSSPSVHPERDPHDDVGDRWRINPWLLSDGSDEESPERSGEDGNATAESSPLKSLSDVRAAVHTLRWRGKLPLCPEKKHTTVRTPVVVVCVSPFLWHSINLRDTVSSFTSQVLRKLLERRIP